MATLWMTVFEHAVEVALGPVLQTGKQTVSGTAASLTAVAGTGRKRRRVRLFADVDCHVAWGAPPQTATTDDFPVGAENPEYIDVEAGQVISVIERV